MDKNTAVKSIIAAMSSMSKIQQEKNKLMANRLQHDDQFANKFLSSIMQKSMTPAAQNSARLTQEARTDQGRSGVYSGAERPVQSPIGSGMGQGMGAGQGAGMGARQLPTLERFNLDVNQFMATPRIVNVNGQMTEKMPDKIQGVQFLRMKKQYYPDRWNQTDEDALMSLSKSAGLSSQQTQPSSSEKTLGTLTAGGYVDRMTGRAFKFRKREDAINYALSNLGPDFEQRYPRAMDIINEKWPSDQSAPTTAKAKTIASVDDWWND